MSLFVHPHMGPYRMFMTMPSATVYRKDSFRQGAAEDPPPDRVSRVRTVLINARELSRMSREAWRLFSRLRVFLRGLLFRCGLKRPAKAA